MQALKQLLAIITAALIGGVFGSVIIVGAQDGVISTNDVVGFAVRGGSLGALVAIISSTALVLFGMYARPACVGLGIAQLGVSVWMTTSDDSGAPFALIGVAVLAGVLADFIARRADDTVSAAAAAAPQGPDSESSDASEEVRSEN
ncbi:hypothetical protein [Actinomadura sp. WMMA1423]|uniref:hypothetical protein n=1 Tax=Actinomadura sp. WMMA1423 TaxID=2591108 RepID=UPI0011469A4C|nr:hypothetical protein [Actinomadura sp. WMMA1423]